MKNFLTGMLFLSSVTSLAANGPSLLANLYSGTQVSFSKRIDMKQGQQSLYVGNRKCKFRFANAAIGKKHIEKNETLVVSHVKVEPERLTFNPSTGEPIKALENIEIRFQGIKSRITCRGKAALSYSIEDLEFDGILEVAEPNQSDRFIIN